MDIDISDLLTPERVFIGSEDESKKHIFEIISQLLVQDSSLDAKALFSGLIARERLGTTAIGHGIAIPHARVMGLQDITGALVCLRRPIDLDSIDHQKVDILFALAVPEVAQDEHLQVLATLAEMFSNDSLRDGLRKAADAQQAYQIMTQFQHDNH